MNVGRWYYLHFSKKKKIFTLRKFHVSKISYDRERIQVKLIMISKLEVFPLLLTASNLHSLIKYNIVVKSIYESQTPRV